MVGELKVGPCLTLAWICTWENSSVLTLVNARSALSPVRKRGLLKLELNAGIARNAGIVSPQSTPTRSVLDSSVSSLTMSQTHCQNESVINQTFSTPLATWDRCWNTHPIWQSTGEVYDQIFIDGTYIAYGWCLLIAASTQGVVAYQLCDKESKAAYQALLERIAPPLVVTTDGQRGALAEIKACWPTTRVQRYLVHI